MARTRRTAIDQDSSWIVHEIVEWNPYDPVAPENDYLIVETFPIFSAGDVAYTQIVIWGVGLISFGPVTAEQTAFMQNLGSNADLANFPGDFAAFSYSPAQLELFQYGVKAGYVYVGLGYSPSVTITPDAISVGGTTSDGSYFGLHFGGHEHTSTSPAFTSIFFSDLVVTEGTLADDALIGTARPETLLGLDGEDLLSGNAGGDRLEGGIGSDFLDGGDGNDRLFGGDDADALLGGAGNDLLSGGGGDDVLRPGAGSDQIDGGDGIDRVELDYAASATSIDFSFDLSAAIPTSGGSVTVINVEAVSVRGSQYIDVIEGTAFDDELFGGGGNDLLIGGDGSDLLDAGLPTGSSIAILPPAGTSFANAVAIDRFFEITANTNIFESTTVPHASLDVQVTPEPFGDYQEVHRYLAITVTEAGASLTVDVDGRYYDVDTFVGVYDSSGALVAFNDDGDYFALGGFDVGTENPYDSLLTYTFAAAGTYFIDVGSISTYQTSTFSVHFSLSSAVVATEDDLRGGRGDDTYVVYSQSDQVVELVDEGQDEVIAGVSYVLGANFERLTLTGTAAISGTGNALNNIVVGNAANNVINGRGGADSLRGNAGNDIYYVDHVEDRVIELSAADGNDQVRSTVSFTLGNFVEQLELSGTAAVNGTGNTLNNIIWGNAANNVINGGAGADSLRGGAGNDIYYIDNAGDRIVESAGAGIDQVRSGVDYRLAVNIETLVLSGSAVRGIGNDLSNTIYGNDAANFIDGRGGADSMRGGAGNDSYTVDNLGDRTVELETGGVDRVISHVDHALGVNVENLIMYGTAVKGYGNDLVNSIVGNAVANILQGRGGNDVLSGGAGDDRLYGGAGNDRLAGGEGADRFTFDTALSVSTNVDRVTDFSIVDDSIMLDLTIFSGLATTGRLAASAFASGTAAADADDRIVYDSATGRIYYDADGSGAGSQVLFAQVTAGLVLTSADFIGVA